MEWVGETRTLKYQQLRQKFGSMRNLWDHLRAALYLILFTDIDNHFERMLDPRKFT
jgi:hypothetical protein